MVTSKMCLIPKCSIKDPDYPLPKLLCGVLNYRLDKREFIKECENGFTYGWISNDHTNTFNRDFFKLKKK